MNGCTTIHLYSDSYEKEQVEDNVAMAVCVEDKKGLH